MNIQNYINGNFHNPIKDNWIDNYNPSNGDVYGQIPNSSKEDVENAYIAAKSAFPTYSVLQKPKVKTMVNLYL